MTSTTVDTNVLIYAVDVDAGPKHVLAAHIIGRLSANAAVLPLQCLSEFYRATTKKHRLLAADAAAFVGQFGTSMQIIPAATEDLSNAMLLHQRHGFQFFDALLVATARRAGCTTLFSEDMQDGRTIDGVTIRNPFTMSEVELDAFFA